MSEEPAPEQLPLRAMHGDGLRHLPTSAGKDPHGPHRGSLYDDRARWLVRRHGLIGIALGTAIPAIIFEYPFLRLVTSIVGMSVKEYVAVVIRPTLVPALVIFVPAMIVAASVPRTSVAIVAATLGCGGVYAVWFWLRRLSHSERCSVLQHSPALPNRLNKWLLGQGA